MNQKIKEMIMERKKRTRIVGRMIKKKKKKMKKKKKKRKQKRKKMIK